MASPISHDYGSLLRGLQLVAPGGLHGSRPTYVPLSRCRIAALAAQAKTLCPRMDSPSRFQ